MSSPPRPCASRHRVAQVPSSSGRLLEATDRRGAAAVAVVNETYARRYFDGQNPIGQRIFAGGGAMRPGGVGFGQLSCNGSF